MLQKIRYLSNDLNPFEWPNRLKIIIASNNDWVVPATCDERRYFVLDGNPVFARNRNDLEVLNKATEAEAQAFLEALLSKDISDFDYRNAPHTKAMNEQKALTFDIVESFWKLALVELLYMVNTLGLIKLQKQQSMSSWIIARVLITNIPARR